MRISANYDGRPVTSVVPIREPRRWQRPSGEPNSSAAWPECERAPPRHRSTDAFRKGEVSYCLCDAPAPGIERVSPGTTGGYIVIAGAGWIVAGLLPSAGGVTPRIVLSEELAGFGPPDAPVAG